MKTLNLALLREAVVEGRIQWRKHALQKLAERDISQQAVRDLLLNGERIQDYTEDKPFPSAVFGVCFWQAASRGGRVQSNKRTGIWHCRL